MFGSVMFSTEIVNKTSFFMSLSTVHLQDLGHAEKLLEEFCKRLNVKRTTDKDKCHFLLAFSVFITRLEPEIEAACQTIRGKLGRRTSHTQIHVCQYMNVMCAYLCLLKTQDASH